jgi:protein O-GlcNAc transferase
MSQTIPGDFSLDRATALLKAGQAAEALALLSEAAARFPRHAAITGRIGDALHTLGRLDEAVVAYRSALDLDARLVESWYGLGCAELARRHYGAAAAALGRTVALDPKAAGAACNFGKALFELGRVEAALVQFRNAVAGGDAEIAAIAGRSIATVIPGADSADHAQVLAARQDWARREATALPAPPPRPRPRAPGERLRIGYLSAFFGARNWMKPVFGLINRHDRSRFDVHMFSDGGAPAPAAGYAEVDTDTIHDLRGVDNARAAAIIAAVGIDVLVDLNGYSFPQRLPLLMLRPAPVIVGWFNMFATTGLAACDWLVGDDAVIRPEEERHYVERIHRLPGSYLAFDVRYPVPPVVPPPSVAAGVITFGCLGSQYKLTDRVLAAWGRILRAVPTARLWLRNGTLNDETTRADLTERLAGEGVEAARLVLEGGGEHFDFLKSYDHIDIALDTFPYNGGTTTTEALWQGVPVLSFDGDRWASRTSRSLLLAAGLDDWVAADEAGYVARAIALARDPTTPAMLAALRAALRARLAASPVCDCAALCREMESFYRRIAFAA